MPEEEEEGLGLNRACNEEMTASDSYPDYKKETVTDVNFCFGKRGKLNGRAKLGGAKVGHSACVSEELAGIIIAD